MSNRKRARKEKIKPGRAIDSGNLTFLLTKRGKPIGSVPTASVVRREDGAAVIDPSKVRVPVASGPSGGPCLSCMEPTDTGLILFGPQDFHVAAMALWGLSEAHAKQTLRHCFETRPGGVLVFYFPTTKGEEDSGFRLDYRVCSACANNSVMTPALCFPGAVLPVYAWHRMETAGLSAETIRALDEILSESGGDS